MSRFLHGAEVVPRRRRSAPHPNRLLGSHRPGRQRLQRAPEQAGPHPWQPLPKPRVFGGAGTLADAVRAILDQSSAAVVCVDVFDPDTHPSAVPAGRFTLDGDSVVVAESASAVVVENKAGSTHLPDPVGLRLRSRDRRTHSQRQHCRRCRTSLPRISTVLRRSRRARAGARIFLLALPSSTRH